MDEQSLRRAAVGLRYSRRAGGLFLLALALYLLLPSPWTLLAAVCAVAALMDQIRAYRAFGVIRHTGQLQTMAAISAVACAMLVVLAAAPAILDLVSPAQRECRRGANTAAARAACDERYGRAPMSPYLAP